jgi:hypothetical protein
VYSNTMILPGQQDLFVFHDTDTIQGPSAPVVSASMHHRGIPGSRGTVDPCLPGLGNKGSNCSPRPALLPVR